MNLRCILLNNQYFNASFFLFLFLLCSGSVISQNTCDVYFYNQADVDAFPSNYPGCTEITGSLSFNSNNITNVDSLYSIEKVGVLYISSNFLQNVDGLNNLKHVSSSLSIYNYPANADYSGLDQIEYIGSDVSLFLDSSLVLNLANLDYINGDLYVSVDDDENITVPHFSELDTVVGRFRMLRFNDISAITVPEFNNLKMVGESFELRGNFLNSDFSGFQSLESVGTSLTISYNNELTDISGFSMLNSIGGTLSIQNQNALSQLSGFNQLESSLLSLNNLQNLSTISGFQSLDHTPYLYLRNLLNLGDLSFMNSVNLVEDFNLILCNDLTSLTGINPSIKIDKFSITNNNSLSSVVDLEGADFSELTRVSIFNNALLNECAISTLCSKLPEVGNKTISGNLPGCNTENEILNRCLESGNPPSNDECSGSITMLSSSDISCANSVSGTTNSSRNHDVSNCVLESPDEVFYSFTPSDSSGYTIQLSNLTKNLIIELYAGDCMANEFISCGLNTLNVLLDANQEYLIKIYNEIYTEFTDYDLCIFPVDSGTLPEGKVGIATSTPLNNLHVDGGITFGNSSAEIPGTIRFDGTKFQGNTGLGWVDLSPNNAEYQANDPSPTNEIQFLSKSGNTISLSTGGGSVQDEVDDADSDPLNEIQTLTQSGSTITLSNGGGSVTASGGAFENVNGTIKSTGGNDDDFVVGSASLPSSNATTEDLFFFDESKASFRAGRLKNSTSWSESNIGFNSFAIGENTLASSLSSCSFGRYNVGGGQANQWVEDDPLFEIGNGSGPGVNTSNALTVLKKGFTGIQTASPASDLHVLHGNQASTNGLMIQNDSTFSNFRLYTHHNGAFRLYGVDPTIHVGSIDPVSGVYTANSDLRLKESLEDLPFDWEMFMQLAPLVYEFKNDTTNKKYIGMIAQEVMKIYPEMVTYDAALDSYHMDYSAFGVIAIKAIQEQQKMIDSLEKENSLLVTEVMSRLDALELKQNTSTLLESTSEKE